MTTDNAVVTVNHRALGSATQTLMMMVATTILWLHSSVQTGDITRTTTDDKLSAMFVIARLYIQLHPEWCFVLNYEHTLARIYTH